MTNLHELQDSLQNYLLKNPSTIQTAIVTSDKVPAAKRLAIYGDAYRLRLLEALAANYPILKRHLGENTFQKIGENYINNYPSSYRSIRWFGDKFADYLAGDKNHNYLYLAELAQFEWHMTLAFDAAEAKVVSIEDMAAIPAESWPTMQFITHPSLHRLNFFWNIVTLWQALANEQSFVEEDLVINNKQLPWVVWRHGYTIRFYSLTEDEAWALDALIQGVSFGELCAGLCEWMEEQEVGMRAASLLKSWIQSGLLAEIKRN
ncbi:HvfC/BufC N-terminal domain-containing protein [Legionella tunisiensis]|uniref:HvfC/BufC N-terminal domain-containing protein n=1 Tax=Legionella tunisiensis TaxID=1034944 RepID=UPI000318DD4E|nr:putative DNA-binding domain-containing protein [Legionella tunisiensis]